MPTPLIATPTQLARSAVGRSPLFAAAMADATRTNEPVMVETRFSKKDVASSRSLFHHSPMTRWAAAVATAGVIAATTGPALTGLPVVQQVSHSAEHSVSYLRAHPEVRHILQRIADRYKRLIGPPVTAQTLRSADQVVEDLAPVAPGQTSPAAVRVSDISSERGQREIIIAAGAILGVGFENLVDSNRSTGMFEANLVKQLTSAMSVVAPGKLLSEMSAAERNAVLTATMYSSNSSFLKIMSSQSPEFAQAMRTPEGARIKNAAETIPPASQFLSAFVKDGAFSLDAFSKEIAASATKAAAAGTSTPAILKAKLLASVALKVKPVLQSIDSSMEQLGVPTAYQNNPVAKYMTKISTMAMQKIAGLEEQRAEERAQREAPDAPNAMLRDPRFESPLRAPQPSI